MLEIRSEHEMIQLGEKIGERLNTGDLLFLSGDLGTGKTTLTKGIAKSLEIKEEITSPTFQIIKSYQGRISLNHLDLYRLKDQNELDIIDPDSLFDSGAVVVEWGDLWDKSLYPQYLEIKIEYNHGSNGRIVTFCPFGPYYQKFIEGMDQC
ncbi:MAG TPA: tRNA (adenosine(37)-N6)-threonylcarbamoyltransferase complex ATPase subunit type 1 TsaE [Firmicutes bacterium]|jgi:tRNA threonylcarbamoyladenosine biosynthesis protein TsaE|nr:tRNA (adenosine(37)-N6)-threonylcarbamoyltransferase complex ATPase subunit type 1 TsaE [Bacillota bacterium]